MTRPSAIDQQTLRRQVIHILEHGDRTSTYKLATMSAIIDYCVKHRPSKTDAELSVPISELARRVMEAYWRQTAPFDGIQLRQSTTPQSRILAAIKEVRTASGLRGYGSSLESASQLVTNVYRRAIADVCLSLARQPLPRLQRSPGSAQSARFLFDDSFLHDKVSLSELQRRDNAIGLYPGVADGLASLALPLARAVRSIWVDDVLRLNHLDAEQRPRLEKHLFGAPLPPAPAPVMPKSFVEEKPTSTPGGSRGGLATPALAARLNQLLATNRKKNGEPYSSGELAAEIRQMGLPMTVTAISQLRAGMGAAPSLEVLTALAKFFRVTPAFLADGIEVQAPAEPASTGSDPRRQSDAPAYPSKSYDISSHGVADTAVGRPISPTALQVPPSGYDDGARGRVIGPDLEDVVAVSRVLPSDCWLAPSQSGVRCRPPGDTRSPLDLPKVPLHRWAWMIANDLTSRQIPTYLIQIRRRCTEPRCCNPDHLMPAAPGGDDLTPGEVVALLDKSYVSPAQSQQRPATAAPKKTPPHTPSAQRPPPVGRTEPAPTVRPPLADDLSFIAAYCKVDAASGCWIAPSTTPVPCRAATDYRPDRDLPKFRVHRWAWMVAHGRSSEPLPGDMFQVWKHCGNSRCANPEHLYLTDPDGEEASVEDVEEWLRPIGTGKQDAVLPHQAAGRHDTIPNGGQAREPSPAAAVGGRHRAAAPDATYPRVDEYHVGTAAVGDNQIFAERLNALFDARQRSDGTPLTSGDVAASLQADGLGLSENLIDGLRAGLAGPASQRTVDALTFFFTVDVDYFSAGGQSVGHRSQAQAPDRPSSPSGTATPASPTGPSEDAPTQYVSMPVGEIGAVLAGLAGAVSDCLTRRPADTNRPARLAPLIVELATLLTAPGEHVTVGRPLLRRVREEWARAGGARHALLDRLSVLIDD